MVYRYDIDGLRALAVLAVVIFHLDPQWLPGGFIGVDIFFVISGFLITGIIVRQVNAGTFSFAEFYRRRILRILPAATLVIATTLIVGHFIMLPEDLLSLAYSAAASQLWVGNIYFTYYLDTGYFADAAILQPLLHLWSLGVEEQFYLFWPAMLVVGLRWFRNRAFWLVAAALMAGSFMLGQYLLPEHASFTYYMLPTRAGQLLSGALVAALLIRWREPSAAAGACLSFVGLMLTLWSFTYLSEDSLYPGFNAIAPTAGAALLLAGGAAHRNRIAAPFKFLPVRYVGLISFSLYLWHWPVISFYWYLYGTPDISAKLWLLALMMGLSMLCYRWIETPFRHLKIPAVTAFLRVFLLPGSALLIASYAVWSTSGLGLYALSPTYADELRRASEGSGPAFSASYVCQGLPITEASTKLERCVVNGEDPQVLLWGDSNAAHYVGAMTHVAETYGFSFRNLAHSSCPPTFITPGVFARARVAAACEESVPIAWSAIANYKVIMMAAAWDSYINKDGFSEALGATIEQLVQADKKVFVFAIIPRLRSFDRNCQLKQLKVSFLNCTDRYTYDHEATIGTNTKIRDIADKHGAQFVNLSDGLCSDDVCPLYIGNEGLYYDSGHWSVSGSLLIGATLAKAGKLPEGFSLIPQILMTSKNTYLPRWD